MDNRPEVFDLREQRLNEVLGAYLEAADAGWAPDPAALEGRYPELADDLHAFFVAQSRVAALAYPCPANASRQGKGAGAGPISGAETAPFAAQKGVAEGRIAISGYESLQLIKAGGMGAVYRAWQKGTERWVALKKIKKGRFASWAEVRRFLDEAQAAANLAHPNIVEIYQVGAENGEPFFSMKLFEHGALQDHLERFKAPRPAAQLLATVARAVHYAHQRGILHRDLKPANILLDVQGQPYVADFGLAKRLRPAPGEDRRFEAESPCAPNTAPSTLRDPKTAGGPDAGCADASYLPPEQTTQMQALGAADKKPAGIATAEHPEPAPTRIGAFLGSRGYAPPEQAGISAEGISTAADVYSLGAILYKMLTGKTLFDAATLGEVIRQVRECAPEPARQLNPSVDVRLEAICLKCLQKDPKNRYGSAEALADDLERWLKGEPPLAWPMPWPLRAWRAARPYLSVGILASLTGFSLAALFFIYYYFDPDRIPRALEEEARQRRVILIGETGWPRWSRWNIGEGTVLVAPETDKPFTITTLENGRLELMRKAPGPRYRFAAEVRHDRVVGNIGSVGIYFGHAEDRTDDGPVHYWWDLAFADVGQEARLRTGPHPDHKYGEIMLIPRRRHGEPTYLATRLTEVRALFLSAVETKTQSGWRSVGVEVSPENIRLFWEGKPFAELTPDQLRKLGETRKGGNEILMREVKFKPDGSLGIFVYNGTASFRNVTVEPVE